MIIWHKLYTLDDLNRRGENTLTEFLGIRFTQIDDDALTASMPVVSRVKQPLGIVHGGANVALAETVASKYGG
jgi:1,4-dihydroxy-2-naphthoyl-CoA hydrolase